MKRLILGSALALACSVTLGAQTAKVKSETKVEVKDGKDVTVTGCVSRSASGTSFLLSNVEGGGATRSYILVSDDDLDDHVGHLVEIKGKATNLGDDGEVEVKTKTKIERDDADDKETTSRTKIEGDLEGIPYLGVKRVKTVRNSCEG